MTMLPIVRQDNVADSIVSVFKISTGHLPEHVFDSVIGGYWSYLIIVWEMKTHDGVFCLIPDTLEDWRVAAEDLPSELFKVFRRAYDQGCQYVWFHPDADEVDLPTWEW